MMLCDKKGTLNDNEREKAACLHQKHRPNFFIYLSILGMLLLAAVFYGLLSGKTGSITLTCENAMGIIAEEEFDRKDDVEAIKQLLQKGVPLEDSDEEIIKRSGGTILVASISDGSKRSETTLLLGIPVSIGHEVTVVKSDDARTYSDADTYYQLLDMMESTAIAAGSKSPARRP